MKNLFKSIFIVIFCLSLFNCSDDKNEETYLYKSEKINFTQIVNSKMGIKSKSSGASDDYMHSEFETSFIIPKNLSDSELNDFILENQSSISGTFKYMINDKDFITVDIVNGLDVNKTTNQNNLLKREYPCSYKGIQACVQHAVYDEWSTLYALYCAVTGGFGCIVDETIDCIGHSC